MYFFEIGNIYPPLEENSLKIQLTQGCSWNKCIFCDSYKDTKFRLRTMKEITSDLDAIKFYQHNFENSHFYERASKWRNSTRAFLADTDVLNVDLLCVMNLVKKKFPKISNFCAYASIRSILKKNKSYFRELYSNGLTRLYIGLESGNEKVLKLMRKNFSISQAIEAHWILGDIEIFDHYIIGLGGREFSRVHALDSARVLNEVKPNGVELRTIQIVEKLKGLKDEGRWIELTNDEREFELRIFMDNYRGKIYNDHSSNKWMKTLPLTKQLRFC